MNINHRNPLLAAALDPDQIEIDGRTYQDRLAFLANFARLILFYDQNNQVAGNWQPFLLKDPILLLAAISKTDYSGYHDKFLQLQQFRSAITDKENKDAEANDIIFTNQLCVILQKMFTEIDRWLRYMELDSGAYTLYDFLVMAISETLITPLGQLITVQQYLYLVTHGQVIHPEAFYNKFSPIWQMWANSAMPDLTDASISQATDLLTGVYYAVLNVYVQTVDSAQKAFEQKSLETAYPDTALLVAFSQLMDIQKAQINKLSRKHLDFYYEGVLQQRLRPAQPDQVYACLTLADKIDTLHLPAKTQFKAGVYPDGSDVLFINETAVDLNQAAIAQASTLYYDQNKAKDTSTLYLSHIPNPTQVLLNTSQEILSWDAFGNTAGQPIQQGFALASPMLFLQGGSRTITISFEFDNNPSQDDSTMLARLFNDCQCYLSTEKAWIQVNGTVAPPSANSTTMAIQLNLSASDPAILAFTKNPDGLTSSWPMFKIMLGQSADLLQPPNLLSVAIHVNVEQLTQLTMANDLSPLPNSGSVSIFGPVPELGSCFYVGSNECFAKPMHSLSLTMNWDHLPANGFDDYYAAYNSYLTDVQEVKPQQELFDNAAFTGQWQLLSHKNQSNPATSSPPDSVSLFQNAQSDGVALNPSSIFNFEFNQNTTSTAYPELILAPLPVIELAKNGYIYFELKTPQFAFGQSLYAKVVLDVSMKNANTLLAKNTPPPKISITPTAASAVQDTSIVAQQAAKEANAIALQAESDANKATTDLAENLTDINLRLINILRKAPKESSTAPTTSQKVIAPPKNKDGLLEMPNLPYSPKQSSLSINYEATSTAVISRMSTASAYPFELYHYGTFLPYLAYDVQDTDKGCGFRILTPKLLKNQPISS